MSNELDCFSVTSAQAVATIICLHGLGANGQQLYRALESWVAHHPQFNFIFPDAPSRPVTANHGLSMPAWYDIYGFSMDSKEDETGLVTAGQQLHRLIYAQINNHIAANRIIVAGFSQGGALALYAGLRFPERLGGVIGLSCYLPVAKYLAHEGSHNNRNVPIFMAHGSQDEVLSDYLARYSHKQLQNLRYMVEFRAYPIGHTICHDELSDLSMWLTKIIAE